MANLFLNILSLIPFVLKITIYKDSWRQTLPALLIGMVGIFIVIGVIILVTYFLNKITLKNSKGDEKKEDK